MRRSRAGFYFILPWLIGLILFTAFPLLAALYIGFTDWNIAGDAQWIGFDNYRYLLQDDIFWGSLWVTFRYAILAVPMGTFIAFMVAVMLSRKIKGVGIYRVIFYLPAVVSGAAVAIIFKWILDPSFGLLNGFLNVLGIQGPDWLGDPNWVLPSYLILALWGAGSGLFIFLAAIKDVPISLYESAVIDGANNYHKTRHITLPLVTPVIFYSLVMGIIGSFRKFTDAFILGGAGGQGRFAMVYLYDLAFVDYRMGRATAMAWLLFIIILTLTILVNISKKYWVHKE
jgi:multiple sugar transport system permease protein